MKNPTLYTAKRICAVCGCSSLPIVRGVSVPADQPNILTVQPVIYRRGANGRAQKGGPSVAICEGCMIRLCAGKVQPSAPIWSALQGAISKGYNACLEADK